MDLDKKTLQYMIGGLLYIPAINEDIADKIENKEIPYLTAIAFCLEDSIQDNALEKAENALKNTLFQIMNKNIPKNELPLIFVRIRNPNHLMHIFDLLGDANSIVTGYIFPKFDLSNIDEYIENIIKINNECKKATYIMPIFESAMIADVENRIKTLLIIKSKLSKISDYVLNIRVGGNDFSNLYGLRRAVNQNIYQIGVIRDIFTDIINVFAADYVVAGPVWEYFGTENGQWSEGLCEEIELDRLNGFIGKTAIHPSQLPFIYNSMKVSRVDYDDAVKILDWNLIDYGVAKSADDSRMNEVKCHKKWAIRIVSLGKIYGIKEE